MRNNGPQLTWILQHACRNCPTDCGDGNCPDICSNELGTTFEYRLSLLYFVDLPAFPLMPSMILLDGPIAVFIGGALGPILIELSKYALSSSETAKYKKSEFWLGFLALLLVSGVVAVVNGIDHVPLIRAVQLGINAPAIVAGLATASKLKNSQRKRRRGITQDTDQPVERTFPYWKRLFDVQSW